MVVRATLEHRRFSEFAELLRPSDLLVINETRVIRARLRGVREPGGGAAEILVLGPADGGPYDPGALAWRALVRPGQKLRTGASVRIGMDTVAHVRDVEADGTRIVTFASPHAAGALMERYGAVPLPPYVGPGDVARDERYQTIFARVPGSVAAPTASLHFTPRVLESVAARGVTIVPLVLDVGLGTFRPMAGETIDEHRMHAERYEIPAATAAAVNEAKRGGRRVIVAGTTALRALEASAADHDGTVAAGPGNAQLFITPGFPFRIADALLTNFHLPRSTLLVLVSAFAGYDRIRSAYATAIDSRYRFFSFGDATFLERCLV